MKRIMKFLVFFLCAATILISCSSGIDHDIKRATDLQCKMQKMIGKAFSGDSSTEKEVAELIKESEALQKDIEKKYTSDADKKKFADAMLKTLIDCK